MPKIVNKISKTDEKIVGQMKTNIRNKIKFKFNDIKRDSLKLRNLSKSEDKNKTNDRNNTEIIVPNIMESEESLESNICADNTSKKRFRKQSFKHKMYGKQNDESLESDPISKNNIDKTLEGSAVPFPDLIESEFYSEGRIKCGKCMFKTDSEAEMILHSMNHNLSVISDNCVLRCPTCDRCLPKTSLRTHVNIHTSEKPFKCQNCNKEFMSRQSLASHEKRHLTNDEELKECQICGITVVSERNFKKHLNTHRSDREKSHSCELCGQSFYEKESLKTHKIRIHCPKKTRRFKCDFDGCRYTTLYQHQLLEHQRTHSDDKPFVCDLCEYSAKSKWSFKKHYRKHTKEKPFKCQVCDYASSLSSNLTRHMRIHTGSKPFKCPYCSYSCNNHENLRKHVLKSKKHKGLHLYNCKHCSFATNSFSELRRHLEDKHNDIYTVEQIDQMISSFYHKNEDNTTIVRLPEPQSDNNKAVDGESHQAIDEKQQKRQDLRKNKIIECKDNSIKIIILSNSKTTNIPKERQQ